MIAASIALVGSAIGVSASAAPALAREAIGTARDGAATLDGSAAGTPAELGRTEAAEARDRAIAWLVREQHEDGSWAYPTPDHLGDFGYAWETYAAYRLAADALACEALRVAPETPDRRAALERGLAWLAEQRPLQRGADWDVDATWGSLYGYVVLVSAALDGRFDAEPWAPRLRESALRFWNDLAVRQTREGGWAYYDDPPFTLRPTWATSFCTALVLPSLIRGRAELALPIGAERVERATEYLRRCALPNGAFAYDLNPVPQPYGGLHIDQVKGSLGRIQVCHVALARAGVGWVTADRVREGLAAFFEHHRMLDFARTRPIPHEGPYRNAGYFYLFAHYYAAQAIELLPEGEREGWHRKLRPHVIKTMATDGSTSDFLTASYQLVAGTSYAALALSIGLADRAEDGR